MIRAGSGGYLLVLAALAWGQAPPVASPMERQDASVTGVVLDDATGAPVVRAIVTLRKAGGDEDAVAWTDAGGAFSFSGIPQERYSINASHTGYEAARFLFPLASSEERRMVLRMRAVGSISGTVSDADGDPVLHAGVMALSAGKRDAPPHRQVAHATTDERGRYHLQRLRPGRYLLVAVARGEQPPAQSEAVRGQPAEEPAHGMRFYPDSDRLSTAGPITLPSGTNLDGFNFHLAPQPATSIEGRVIVPRETAPNTPVHVLVHLEDALGYGTARQTEVNRANGSFQVRGLLWGRYVVESDLTIGGRGYRGMERVDAGPEPGRVTIPLEPLAEVSGAVRIDGNMGGLPPQIRIGLIPRDPLFQSMNLYPQRDLGAEGAFRFEALPPGAWSAEATGLPEGWYVDSMRFGDLDTLAADMPVAPGTNARLSIVLSTRGAVIEGGSRPAAHILLAPVGPLENALCRYYTTTSDAAGFFRMGGIAPGAYRLYAFDNLDAEPGEYPDLVRSLGDAGEPVEMEAGGHASMQVGLISTAPLEGAK